MIIIGMMAEKVKLKLVAHSTFYRSVGGSLEHPVAAVLALKETPTSPCKARHPAHATMLQNNLTSGRGLILKVGIVSQNYLRAAPFLS